MCKKEIVSITRRKKYLGKKLCEIAVIADFSYCALLLS